MKVNILGILVICITSSFIAGMEQKPQQTAQNRFAFSIAIPENNYRSSDDELSPLSTERLMRDAAGSPLRTTQSGSPLLRLSQQKSARNHGKLTPRIEQEMQDNPMLKGKRYTPRSQAVYDIFGDEFQETYNVRHSSDEASSSDVAPACFSPRRHPAAFSPKAVPNTQARVTRLLAETNIDPLRPSEIITDPELLSDPNTTPTMLLQIGMLKNDFALVHRALIEPAQQEAEARKHSLKCAVDAVQKAYALSMTLQTNAGNVEKIQKQTYKAITKAMQARENVAQVQALVADPRAPRLPINVLCDNRLHDKDYADKAFKGNQIIGLCMILLEHHRATARKGNEKEYLDTLSKINTAIWDAHQAHVAYTEEIEDLFYSIWFHLQKT